MGSTMLLQTIDLSYRYPQNEALLRAARGSLRTTALSHVSLDIAAGARIALLGANGSGKSTLMLHCNGTLRPDQGHICLDGQTAGYTKKELRAWRARVALVFQDPDQQIFAGTVAQDISFGPMNLELAREEVAERVRQAMADLGLEDFADWPPHLLSHGQRKRVALAGALAMHPEILLLDEPTAGLDPQGCEALLVALERESARGTTQILSTHDLDFALEWAHTAVILHEGEILASGEPAQLLSQADLMRTAHLRVPYRLRH